jgi:hypothetical protein
VRARLCTLRTLSGSVNGLRDKDSKREVRAHNNVVPARRRTSALGTCRAA